MEVSFVAFHVDDGLLTASSKSILHDIVTRLSEVYEEIVDWDPTKYLGLRLTRDKKEIKIYLDQTQYIIASAMKYRLDETRPVSTPMESGFSESVEDTDVPITTEPYRGIIGCLGHMARNIRPEITYAFAILAKHMTNPMRKHWNAAKRVLSYLYHTRDYNFVCEGNTDLKLEAWSDFNWADSLENRRSRSGGVIMFGKTAILVWSKLQITVALRSTEAEYQAATYTAQNVCYFRNLLTEMGLFGESPVALKLDNKGSIDLTVSTKHHSRVKHIDIKHHFIRKCVQDNVVTVTYVPTTEQIADIFTKPLSKQLFEKFRVLLGIQARGGIRTRTVTDL
jgi:hypothetical protein